MNLSLQKYRTCLSNLTNPYFPLSVPPNTPTQERDDEMEEGGGGGGRVGEGRDGEVGVGGEGRRGGGGGGDRDEDGNGSRGRVRDREGGENSRQDVELIVEQFMDEYKNYEDPK